LKIILLNPFHSIWPSVIIQPASFHHFLYFA